MHGVSLTRFIVGVIGNIISGLLFIGPVPTLCIILEKKSTEEFHPYPYLSTVISCMLWIFYGLPVVHPDSTLVISINTFGLVLELIYLTIFFIYTTYKYKRNIILILLVEVLFLICIAVVTIRCFHTHERRSMFVGIICDVFSIIMYASPLSIMGFMWYVYKTKSAEFLLIWPIWPYLAGLCNGVVWFTYANLKTFDYYIAIGNGVGGCFSFLQVCVWAYYTLRKMSKIGIVHSDPKSGQVEPPSDPTWEELQETALPV